MNVVNPNLRADRMMEWINRSLLPENKNMGLKADVEEVTQHWKRSPWRVKIFLAIALFLSTSSLASLSEAVFKWKGFVLDALAFYKRWVSQPGTELIARLLGHDVPPGFVDNAVLYGLFLGSLARALLFRNLSRTKRVAHIALLAGVYAVMLYLVSGVKAEPNEPTVLILYPLFVFTAYLMTRGAERVLAMAYMVIPPMAVGIIAAVSAGLTR